jgi:SAM-dependent methyltransferase
MDLTLQAEFDRLSRRSEWLASYSIDGQLYGAGLNHADDVRPVHFFRLLPRARRILELGACQGGGTFQLANQPGVEEVVAIEGRDYHVEKARFVQRALGVTNVTFVEANLETFDFASLGRFDAVYCVGLLYHLPQPWELLAKLKTASDVVYLNTHFCRAKSASRTVNGYAGADWRESGFEDPLSGLSTWSFWPTLKSLADMLTHAGFVPEILETDTTGVGQSPHGTTIVARNAASLSNADKDCLALELQAVLSSLPSDHGSQLRGPLAARLAQSLIELRRTYRRILKASPQKSATSVDMLAALAAASSSTFPTITVPGPLDPVLPPAVQAPEGQTANVEQV